MLQEIHNYLAMVNLWEFLPSKKSEILALYTQTNMVMSYEFKIAMFICVTNNFHDATNTKRCYFSYTTKVYTMMTNSHIDITTYHANLNSDMFYSSNMVSPH